jgi:hypothetical protein
VTLREQFIRLWLVMWRMGGPAAILIYKLNGSFNRRIKAEFDRLDREREGMEVG